MKTVEILRYFCAAQILMTDFASILSAATQLPQSDQLRLIDELWGADAAPLSDEWLVEIQRRSQEIDSGNVKTIPWETVREAAIERLGARREGSISPKSSL